MLAEKRNATVQSLSGTGSLRVGAEFLARHYPQSKLVLLPDPTWPNHNKLFPLAGIDVKKYPYFKPETRGLDYEVGHPLVAGRHACMGVLITLGHN